MEEVLKKIYIKIVFFYKRFVLKDLLIKQIEKKYKEEEKEVRNEYNKEEYRVKQKELKKEREREYLKEHIDFNLNNYRLIRYKNKYLEEKCFIIGNGPSLKAEDLDKIVSEYSFGSNKIYKIFPQTKWRPSFLFVEDSLIYQNCYKEIQKLDCPKFISDIALEWTTLPLVKRGIKFFDNLKYWDLYPEYPPLSVDLTRELMCAYNVSYAMLNTAIFMGFKEIYLLGMDLSYDFSTEKRVGRNGELIVSGKVTNHFTKEYLEPGEKTHHTDTKFAKKAFELIENESGNLGIKVFNATRGGKLEVFKRVDFDKIVKRAEE